MEATRPTRILLYAVNGRGLGHLTRLVAIARWLRRLGPLVGGVELCFVTTSEADNLLWLEGFTSFKLPSKSGLDAHAPDRRTVVAMARQALSAWMGTFRPDVLVVDTFARGAYAELPACLDLAAHRVLVMRRTRALSPDMSSAMALYDRVLLTEDASLEGVPASAIDRARPLGLVLSRERGELLSRAEARRALGLPEDARALLVTAGGGGDEVAQASLAALAEHLVAHTPHHVVVAAGPLSRARPVRGDRLLWIEDTRLPDLVQAFDVAITAGGANAVAELWQAGVPTVVRPLAREFDDQQARGERAVGAGAGLVVAPGASDDDVRAAAEALLARPDASEHARALVPRNDARRAAAAILELAVAPDLVDAALGPFAQDACLAPAAEDHVARASAIASWLSPARPPALLEPALEMLRVLTRDEGVPAETTARLADLLSRRLLVGTPIERLEAVALTARALARFSDWPGAFALVRALDAERVLPALDLAREFVELVDTAQRMSLGALALLDVLLGTHALDGRAPDNAVAITAARAHLMDHAREAAQ